MRGMALSAGDAASPGIMSSCMVEEGEAWPVMVSEIRINVGCSALDIYMPAQL